MVDVLCYYGIYHDAIEEADQTFDNVCSRFGLNYDDLMERAIEELETCGSFNDITNLIISALFGTLSSELDNMGIENNYYVNCDDSHFYVTTEAGEYEEF